MHSDVLNWTQVLAPSLASVGVSGWKDQSWAWGGFPGDQTAAAAAEGHFWKPISQFEKELEAVEGKQGLCDVESELGQGHIKNQGRDAKGGMDVTEEKEGRGRGKEKAWKRNIVNLGGLFGFPCMHNEG